MPKDPRSTINDDEWKSLRERADKANPEDWKVLPSDPKAAQRRKIYSANYDNRDNN